MGVFKMSAVTEKEKRTERETGREKKRHRKKRKEKNFIER